MKTCTSCKEIKELSFFHTSSKGKFNKSSICKICVASKSKEYRDNLKYTLILFKKCSKCLETKEHVNFNKRKDSKDGLLGYCKICENKFNCEKENRVFIDKTLIKEGYNVCIKCFLEKDVCNFGYGLKNICKDCVKSRPKIILDEKLCKKCGNLKLNSEFNISSYNKDGLSTYCKACKNSYKSKEYEQKLEGEKICKSCNKLLDLSKYHKNKILLDGVMNFCKECNKNRVNEWKKNNKDKVREYNKNLINNNNLYKLSHKIRNNIGSSFRRACKGEYTKSISTENILGCSIQEFILHLKSLFQDGMSFENHGVCKKGNCNEIWHIDHKIPISSARTEDDIIKLNHYTNLQPMWASDNLSKGKK